MILNNQTGSDGRGTPTHGDVIAPDAQPATDTTASGMIGSFRTPSAGPSVAVAMWKVAASVVTLLWTLFYGIGRLLADGFYSNLNTTVGAAGVNTISIIEPAAILGALLALSITVILMLSDILKGTSSALAEQPSKQSTNCSHTDPRQFGRGSHSCHAA